MTIMPNNLEAMIQRSGLAKKEVAAAKGVTPETLSRHIHGKIQMTLQDAEAYAKVLDCLPEEILFQTKPMPIIARWKINADDQPYLEQDDSCKTSVYLNAYYRQNTACIASMVGDEMPWRFEMWNNQLEVIDYTPAQEGRVSKDCFQQPSYAMTEDGRLLWGLIYPEPGGTYTIHANQAPGFSNETGTKLKWACPVLSIERRPDLLGVRIVTHKD